MKKEGENDSEIKEVPKLSEEPLDEVNNALEMMAVEIIKSAQKERIGATFDLFMTFMKKHEAHS